MICLQKGRNRCQLKWNPEFSNFRTAAKQTKKTENYLLLLTCRARAQRTFKEE